MPLLTVLIPLAGAGLACSAHAAPPSASASASAGTSTAANSDPAEHYAVRAGDSLTTISRHFAAATGIAQPTVEEALLKANPKAFIGGNANRLRTDVVLTVPPTLRKGMPMAPQASEAVLAPPETRSADISSVAAAVSAMLGPVPDDLSNAASPVTTSGASPASAPEASTPASMAAASEPLTQATAVRPGAVSSAAARLEAPATGTSGASAATGSAAISISTPSISTPSTTASATSPLPAGPAASIASAPAPRPAAAQLRWVIPLLVIVGLFLAWFSRRRWANPPPLPAGSPRKGAGRAAAAGDVPARPADTSGKDAGRREVEALEVLRETSFNDREEAALQVQLSRAPRDVGALFGLLQLHARRGDREKVAAFAHALWDETDAEGELWRRAATIGRSIDPDNPLYSEDPFTALAEHAARQPVRAALPIAALDLSLPDAMGAADSDAVRAVDDRPAHLSDDVIGEADVFEPKTGDAGVLRGHAEGARSSSALPASFEGLDLNLDHDDAATPSPSTTVGKAERARRHGKPGA